MGGKVWSVLEERVFWTVIVPLATQGREAPAESTFEELLPRMNAMGEPDRRNYTAASLYEHWHLNAVQLTFSPNGRMHALRWIRDEPARCLALGMRSRYNIVNGTITTDKGEVIKLPAGSASNAIANHNQGLASRPRSAAPTPSSQAPNNPGSINQPLSGQTSGTQGPQAPSIQAPNVQSSGSQASTNYASAIHASAIRASATQATGVQAPSLPAPGSRSFSSQALGNQISGHQAPSLPAPGTRPFSSQALGPQVSGHQASGAPAPGTRPFSSQALGAQISRPQASGSPAPGTRAPGTQGFNAQSPMNQAHSAHAAQPHGFGYSHGGPNNFGPYGPVHGFGSYGQSPISGYSNGQARALPSPNAPRPTSTRGTNRLSIQNLLSEPEAAQENLDTMFISARDLFDEADEKEKAIAAKQEAALHSIETGSAKKAKPNKPKYVVYFGPDQGKAKRASTPPPEGTKGKGAKKFTIFKHESVDSQHQRHGDNSEALSEPAAQSSPLPLVPQHQPQRPDLAQDNARWEREMRDNAAEMRRLQERNSQLARLSWENMAYHHPTQPQAVWRPAPSGYYDHREYPVGGYQNPGPYQDPGFYHRGPAPGSYYGRDSEEERRREEERREEERREMERRYYQREQ